MGQGHSGGTSDLLLNGLMESTLLTLSEKHVLGIKAYARFRDDIFILVASMEQADTVFSRMSGLAKPAYTLEIDGVDDDSVVMLDIEIYKSQRGANWILRHKPYVKPTARHIPLGSDSYHPRSVHQSWPRAEMLRLHKRASLPQQSLLFRLAKKHDICIFWLGRAGTRQMFGLVSRHQRYLHSSTSPNRQLSCKAERDVHCNSVPRGFLWRPNGNQQSCRQMAPALD